MSASPPHAAAAMPRLRRILWLLAPPGLFFAVVLRSADLSALRAVLVPAAPQWLLAAAFLAGAFAVNQGALYQSVFRILGEDITLGHAVSLSLVMAFASLALPAGTASGIAYFVSAARERGIASPRALLAALAYYLFEYGALLPVLLIGMAVLRLHRDLAPASLIALALFYAIALGTAGLMVWGVARPETAAQRLTEATNWLRRTVRGVGGLLPAPAVARFAGEIQAILVLARRRPARAVRPLLHAALLQAIALGLLDAIFSALGFRLAPAVLVAGYAVGTIFMLVSITPSGAGIVEGAMTVTFTSLGVPLEAAASATVLFRLYTFWLPMLAGFITLRWVRPVRI
ncbi:MAG TPA: lysylphosphatidylglycerol synthase transmembrane domain-containing protein [bacterium]|nr:lysylphosphatidylglycerol synthase transmembrane domain-containing protein [bacterium]